MTEAKQQQQQAGWNGDERRHAPRDHEILRHVDEVLDQRLASPGLKVRTFGDLQAALSIAIVLLAGIAWGLKLESRLEDVLKQTQDLQVRVSRGILPLTEERLNHLAAILERQEVERKQVMDLVRDLQKECIAMQNGKGK